MQASKQARIYRFPFDTFNNCVLIEPTQENVDIFSTVRARPSFSKATRGLLINERDNQVLSSQSN